MAFTANFVCTSFKEDLLWAGTISRCRAATPSSWRCTTTPPTFNAIDHRLHHEPARCTGTNYTAGQDADHGIDPSLTSTTAWTDFDDVTWAASTITAEAR